MIQERSSNACIINTLRNIRWNRGLARYYDFIRSGGGLSYSDDGIEWKHVPRDIRLNLSFDLPVKKITKLDEFVAVQRY